MTLPQALALPTGYESVAGNVQFSQEGNTLNVSTGAQRSIANYRTFNIGQNETVNFRLPGSNSVILNRVVGGSPSEIFGRMTSNGQVFLVNPSGIFFGPTAQVNVGSLFASTMNISDEDFLGGNQLFRQGASAPALIRNEGRIEIAPGGYGVLAAGAIQNTGEITAPQGHIELAVGKQVRLNTDDFLAVEVTVDEPLQQKVDAVQDAILNQGRLQADEGIVKMTAALQDDLYAKAINNEGVVAAQGFTRNGGTVEFFAGNAVVRNTGTVDVASTTSNLNGGRISVAGGTIEQQGIVAANAADGETAGEINLTASGSVLLESGSRTEARATGSHGNGGRITIWSEQFTDLSEGASVNTSAGLLSGDGGFIELSSKGLVKLSGNLSAAAYHGQAGTILIDPTNVRITNLSLNNGSANIPHTDPDNNGGESTFDPASFAGFSNVNIEATNDITVESPFALNNITSGNSLSLKAGNDISIQSAVNTGGGNIRLTADADLSASGGPASDGVGSVTVTNTGSLASNNGTITLQGTGIQINGTVNAGTGRIVATSTQDISVGNTGVLRSTGTAGASGSETVSLNAQGEISLQGGAANQSGSIVASSGNVRLVSSGNRLLLTGGNGTESGSILTGGNLVINTNRLELNGGAGDRSGSILAGGNVTVSAVGINFLGPDGMIFNNAGETVFTPCGDDCNSGLVNFGFNFNFFGTSVSNGQVITNGYLWLGNNANTDFVFNGFPLAEANGKIALFQADLNPDLGGSIGYSATGTEFFTTFRDVQDVNGLGVLNGQIGLLNSGNSLGLRQGTVILSYGNTQTTPYNTTATGAGLNAGNGTGFATLNPLGIGASDGILTAAQLQSLAGRSFAFTPNGSGGYTVSELSSGIGGGVSITGGGGISSGAIISSTGNISMTTNGNVTLTGGGGANSGSLITNGAGRNIDVVAGGNIASTAGSLIRTNNGTINLESLDLDIGGTLDAGTGTIVLNPFDDEEIKLGDNADGDGDDAAFDINAAELANITAETLRVGSTAKTGDLILQGSLDVSGAGPAGAYNLDLRTGSNYTGSGQTLTLGTKILNVTSLGSADTGTITGGNTTVSISAGDTLTVDGPVTVGAGGSISLSTSSNDNIILGANVGGGSSTTISANGTGTITQTGGTLTGTTLQLSSGTGDIGTSVNPVQTDAGTVRVSTGGDAYLQDSDTMTIGTSTVDGTLEISAADDLTTTGAVSAADLSLTTTANNGSITLNSTVTGTNTVLLQTDGSGSITSPSGRLNGGTASIISSSGNISLKTSLTNLSGSTTGSIQIAETGQLTIDAGHLSAGGDLTLTTGGDLTSVGEISGRYVLVDSEGAIVDGNGNANNLSATAGGTLRAYTIIGNLTDPFDVTVSGGSLGVHALGAQTGVSVNINGSVAPVDTLNVLNAPPGLVIYNGRILYRPLPYNPEPVQQEINRHAYPYFSVLIEESLPRRILMENRITESYILNGFSPKLADTPETRQVNLPVSGILMK